ncbi:hypothetical protein [Megamonas hypermegale]|uniref:hypothetical protein n=1 Tax=Megamonas hypermegale TaxID=158847 RepID=UPI00195D37D3|nr:hypothetical protein [Megamonas hypermegale]MBM6761470.1 hypothetical protein [Megamonas hypermegale]
MTKNKDCIKIYYSFLKFKLKANELLLFSLLYQECEHGAVYKKGLNYLSKRTNTAKNTVLRCLQVLIDKNLIIKKQGTGNQPSEYRINHECMAEYMKH